MKDIHATSFTETQSPNDLTGAVLTVERQTAHEEFLQALEEAGWKAPILLRINHVRALVNQGETADSFYGDRTVVTTTTCRDEFLEELDWRQELSWIEKFRPDYHVPTDYPVYEGDSPERRKRNIENMLTGAFKFQRELQSYSTQILPLIKGERPHEREICYNIFDSKGVEVAAFYGSQYYLGNVGGNQLVKDVGKIASEKPELKIFLIGCQSTRDLSKMPPQVVGAAGQKWLNDTEFRAKPNHAAADVLEMREAVQNAVDNGQVPLSAWAEDSGVTA
jgi:hypothetical protein